VDFQNNIALDGDDMPYVIFPDGADSGKASVMKYDGSWVYAGNTGFSAGQIWYPNIATDANNNVYVEYYDEGDSLKMTVKKYEVTTTVREVSTDEDILIWPNPANELVTVHAKPLSGNSGIIVMNSLGQEIYCRAFIQNETIIDVSDWSAGIYFIMLNDGERQSVQKLIVQ
jgi:hypothetical protein